MVVLQEQEVVVKGQWRKYMRKRLLIVFVKNAQLGKVKTRLAKTIGAQNALDIYHKLTDITKQVVNEVKINTKIYFSSAVENKEWSAYEKYLQEGKDLGYRMQNAIRQGFKEGYESIALIGSDLPSLSSHIINEAFNQLEQHDVVIGPAEDGGYYLIGMNKLQASIFKNKSWSQEQLYQETIDDFKSQNLKWHALETLNDIDTFEDLKDYPHLLNSIEKTC